MLKFDIAFCVNFTEKMPALPRFYRTINSNKEQKHN